MKIYAYTVFIILMDLLFNIAGVNEQGSAVATRLGIFNLTNITNSSFWSTVAIMFAVVSAIGAIVGSFAGSSVGFVLKGIYIMTPLTLFVLDLISILNQVSTSSWVFWIMGIIIIPLAGAYVIALVEFWDGRD
jgi:hypothetical protein